MPIRLAKQITLKEIQEDLQIEKEEITKKKYLRRKYEKVQGLSSSPSSNLTMLMHSNNHQGEQSEENATALYYPTENSGTSDL